MTDESKLIEQWQSHYKEIKEKQEEHAKNMEFNIFKIVSDLYYRENFHSDIIVSFLKNKEINGLSFFIKMLSDFNSLSGKKIKADIDDFPNVKICKEFGTKNGRRIDILIYSEDSKKAIIIENKINDAPDQPMQIYDYYEHITKNMGIEVVAIVYLPLSDKDPPVEDWAKKEYAKEIENKLLVVPAAYSTIKNNLSKNWLVPCIDACKNKHKLSVILEQYNDIIKELSKNRFMNDKVKDFYNLIKGNANDTDNRNKLNIAISITQMLDGLTEYRAKRIKDKFSKSKDKFEKIIHFPNAGRSCWVTKFQNYEDKKFDLWLRVECLPNKVLGNSKDENFKYVITINEGKTFENNPNRLEKYLDAKKIKTFFKESKAGNEFHFKKIFLFPNEDDDLDNTIENLLEIINDDESLKSISSISNLKRIISKEN